MTEQFKAATIRALYGAILSAALIFLQQVIGVEHKTTTVIVDAAYAAALGFVTYMFMRGVAEGLIDSNRGPTSADVGQPKR